MKTLNQMKTIKEVAEIFRVTERTIKRWIANEIIIVVRVGGTVRITEEEIERVKARR